MKQTPDKTFNILLFGETGAGKSTTINALANYLKYNSFENAINSTGDLTQVIPSKFTLLDPETYEDLVIQHGDDDENELYNDQGNSVTQSTKSYSFDFKGKSLRIIDTPGIGDTGGIEVDKRNFENILEHLKTHFETLHGICFLIKTNTTRKTAFFAYCLNKLLTTLHRNACANLIFCFTFSRNSLYGPGDGHQTLKGFLASNELQLNSIELKTGVNCFYIDNKAFRYLCARKHNYPFAEDREEMYRESWDKSVEQSLKMLDRITSIAPHYLRDTFMVVKARKMLPLFAEQFNDLKTIIISLDNNCENAKIRLGNLSNQNNFNEFQNVTKYVQCNLKKIKEINFELNHIENFILKISEFVILNSNTRCEKLVEPYLDILLKEGALIKSLHNENRENYFSQTKKRKISIETASLSSEAKFQMYLELIQKKYINEIVSVDEIEKLINELLMQKSRGDSFAEQLGVEKPIKTDNSKAESKLFNKNITETRILNTVLAINPNVKYNGHQNQKVQSQNKRPLVPERVAKENALKHENPIPNPKPENPPNESILSQIGLPKRDFQSKLTQSELSPESIENIFNNPNVKLAKTAPKPNDPKSYASIMKQTNANNSQTVNSQRTSTEKDSNGIKLEQTKSNEQTIKPLEIKSNWTNVNNTRNNKTDNKSNNFQTSKTNSKTPISTKTAPITNQNFNSKRINGDTLSKTSKPQQKPIAKDFSSKSNKVSEAPVPKRKVVPPTTQNRFTPIEQLAQSSENLAKQSNFTESKEPQLKQRRGNKSKQNLNGIDIKKANDDQMSTENESNKNKNLFQVLKSWSSKKIRQIVKSSNSEKAKKSV